MPSPEPPFARRAAALDAADPLARFRERFFLPEGTVYLDGNSLGLLSRDAERSLLRVLDEWRTRAIDGWLEGDVPWFGLAEALGERLGRLLGAEPGSVVVTGTTTVNLHQLLATLYRPEGPRRRIVMDGLAFPSDVHAVRSHLRLRGEDPDRSLFLVPPGPDGLLDEANIIAALTPETALAVLPAVVYTTGQLLEMGRVQQAGRAAGVPVGWDCSHSVGAVPHELDRVGADFAFWCGYKYLNGGPGSSGGLYLNRRHWSRSPGMAGWWGVRKDRQFEMRHEHEPAPGAGRLQVSTPNLLSLAPLEGALSVIEEAGLAALREKSLALTEFLADAAEEHLADGGVRVVTPREPARRGGHVALRHPEAARLYEALRQSGITTDHRPPDLLRICPAPLYNRFGECWEAVNALRGILSRGIGPPGTSPTS